MKTLASLKVTVVVLFISFLLVFFGTLAQVELGISRATILFFRSWFVFWQPESRPIWKLPIVLPGAWTIGLVLLVNLVSAFLVRFTFSLRKAGLLTSHMGIIILLVGELLTGIFQVETYLKLDEGETRNYTVSRDEAELVIIELGEDEWNTVYAFDNGVLSAGNTLTHPELPIELAVSQTFLNASLAASAESRAWQPIDSNLGVGTNLFYRELPQETEMGSYDQPLILVDLKANGSNLGTMALSTMLRSSQQITVDGIAYALALRPRRYAYPFEFTLIDFRHDRYPGTNKPRNFSSQMRLVDASRGEDREVLVKMNEPLRYAGLTFYQHSFDNADTTTILQVVRNPARWLPYVACAFVFFGLLFDFSSRLYRHTSRE